MKRLHAARPRSMRGAALSFMMGTTLVLAMGLASAPAAHANVGNTLYKVEISWNCDDPSICGGFGSGFWGSVEFNSDNTFSGQATFGGHEVRGGNTGFPPPHGFGQHFSADGTGWYIGSNGDFYLDGPETDTYAGHGPPVTITFNNVDADQGIPATPGHYSTVEVLGFSAPEVSFQVQVTLLPQH